MLCLQVLCLVMCDVSLQWWRAEWKEASCHYPPCYPRFSWTHDGHTLWELRR